EDNTAGTEAIAEPVLLIHGDRDDLVPVDTTIALADRLCRLGGAPVELLRYPDGGHSSVMSESAEEMLAWIDGRFAGEGAPSICGG
ncbi:MAG: alpha/beta hydrolase family protein, partial [Actinomycetota bacterium]